MKKARMEPEPLSLANRAMVREDWDFSQVPDSEAPACRLYEYARESRTMVGVYDRDEPLPGGIGGRLSYCANVGGHRIRLPHPASWPWPRGGRKFEDTPWQQTLGPYRESVAESYRRRARPVLPAVRRADSPQMAPAIISRGNERAGIDWEAGIERVALEIDWATCHDNEIVDAFRRWVATSRPRVGNKSEFEEWLPAGYPPNLGVAAAAGREETKECRKSLERLGIFRLRLRYSFAQMREFLSANWADAEGARRLDQSKYAEVSECNREFRQAIEDFHALFPFVPQEEMPRSLTPKREKKPGNRASAGSVRI